MHTQRPKREADIAFTSSCIDSSDSSDAESGIAEEADRLLTRTELFIEREKAGTDT